MSPAEFKAARDALGMSTAAMAEWLGLELPNGERRIRRMEAGQEEIWGPIARAVQLGVLLADALPIIDGSTDYVRDDLAYDCAAAFDH